VPSVEYHVTKTDGEELLVENPALMPPASVIDWVEEPYVKARIMVPSEYIGPIMTLGTERRGEYKGMHYIDTTRVEIDWEFPLAEIILDFFDRLKSISRGYASLDYEMLGYRRSDLVRLDMLNNGDPIDAFSVITGREAHHASDVAHHAPALEQVERRDLSDARPPVLVADVLDDAVALVHAEVDVEVGHRHALGIEEALEEEVVRQGAPAGRGRRLRFGPPGTDATAPLAATSAARGRGRRRPPR
jgi:hypothetical protein